MRNQNADEGSRGPDWGQLHVGLAKVRWATTDLLYMIGSTSSPQVTFQPLDGFNLYLRYLVCDIGHQPRWKAQKPLLKVPYYYFLILPNGQHEF